MSTVLLITHTPPWPVTNGGHQRTNLLLRALRSMGGVDLALLPRSTFRYPAESLDHLRRRFGLIEFLEPRPWGTYGLWRGLRPFSPAFVDTMARRFGRRTADYQPDPRLVDWLDRISSHRRYDLIVGRYLQPTVRSGAMEFAPLVLDIDDLDMDRLRTERNMPGTRWWRRWVLHRQMRCVEQAAGKWLARPDHLWVCSEADRQVVGRHRATILPNIPYVAPGAPPIDPCPPNPHSRTVLIVGSLGFLVNARAVDRYLLRAWPAVYRACPDAVFRIVGAGMTAAQARRWGCVPGVQPIGFVENLRNEYAGAAFTVAPLFEGGGTKIKVLESLAYGRTCVLARHAQRGFEHVLVHGDSLWVADDDEDLAMGCIALLKDPQRRTALAGRGQQLVAEHFTFDRFQQIVSQTVAAAAGSSQGGVRRSAERRTRQEPGRRV